jgi:hypothetical protein
MLVVGASRPPGRCREEWNVAEVTHVVLVQWRDGEDRSAEADRLSAEHLPRIEGVDSVRSGTSVSTEGLEGDFVWMLVVRFRGRADLDAYLPHPEHQPVASFIQGAAERVVVFDIEA